MRAQIGEHAGSDLRGFYAARDNRPLWIATSGEVSPAAGELLREVASAQLDGLKPRKLKLGDLQSALDRARDGSPEALARAELALSKTYVAYVKALRAAPHAPMSYESVALSPIIPTTTAALQAAAAAPALPQYVQAMGWMNPLYAPLRKALADPAYDGAQRRQIALNLQRVRAIPANPARRYVLIDTNSARLWMYQDGHPVDTMRVVVGKPAQDTQTPMMAGFIRYAIINPYWNVPDDLVRSRIAYNVNAKGLGYLRDSGYQVLSDWSAKPAVVDPATIDWRAVEAGGPAPRVRQLPGGSNFMGVVKFEFPNPQGIYLHDTPDKDLLRKDERQFSSGCVRLEDAPRLGRWLLNKPLPRRSRGIEPERKIELPEIVPVYITYLTAMPENGEVAFRTDVYARDLAGDGTRFARNDRAAADRP
jgi:murein L,D-transpeptidase YcbB/YkuD